MIKENLTELEEIKELEKQEARAKSLAAEIEWQLVKAESLITQYFVNPEGAFLGAFSKNNPAIPEGAIEVPTPPDQALTETWDFKSRSWRAQPEEKLKILKDDLISVRKGYLKSSADYYAPDFPHAVLVKRSEARNEIEAILLARSIDTLKPFIDYNSWT